MTGSDKATANWVENFYREVDKLDIECLSECIAEDIEVHFGNNPPIHGKAAALETFRHFWGTIAGMSHKREELILVGNLGVLMATVTYTRLDNSTVPLPVASYVRKNAQGKIDRLWVYLDLAPLFS